MKMQKAAILFTIVFFSNLSWLNANDQTASERSCCSIVEQALSSVGRIKPGATRADVERDFTLDGGLDFGPISVYTFKGCPLIKIRIEFTKGSPGAATDSQSDVIKSISQPYLQYPVRD
jgi:hypothetical protein